MRYLAGFTPAGVRVFGRPPRYVFLERRPHRGPLPKQAPLLFYLSLLFVFLGLTRRAHAHGSLASHCHSLRLEVVEIYAACAQLGLVCVPIWSELSVRELSMILRETAPRLLICSEALCPKADAARRELPFDLTTMALGSRQPLGKLSYEATVKDAASASGGDWTKIHARRNPNLNPAVIPTLLTIPGKRRLDSTRPGWSYTVPAAPRCEE